MRLRARRWQSGATLMEVMLSMLLMACVACGTLSAMGLSHAFYERIQSAHQKSLEQPSIVEQLP